MRENNVIIITQTLIQFIFSGLNGSLSYDGYVGGSKDTYHYKNDNIDAIINFNKDIKGVHGDISTSTGEFYYLEYCGFHRHALKRLNTNSINKKKCVLLDPKISNKRSIDFVPSIKFNHLQIESRWFPKTPPPEGFAKFSVKIYYTPEFKQSTPDLKGYFNQVIHKTNMGYIKSNLPFVSVKLFCYQMTTFHESNNLRAQIYEFAVMQKTTADLLGTADAAVLFVRDDPYACGVVLSYK